MYWSKEKPATPGWYGLRDATSNAPDKHAEVVVVFEDSGILKWKAMNRPPLPLRNVMDSAEWAYIDMAIDAEDEELLHIQKLENRVAELNTQIASTARTLSVLSQQNSILQDLLEAHARLIILEAEFQREEGSE